MKKISFMSQNSTMSNNTLNSSSTATHSESNNQSVFLLPSEFSTILSRSECGKYSLLSDDAIAAMIATGDNTAAVYFVFYRYPYAIEKVVRKYFKDSHYDNIEDFRAELVSFSYECIMAGKWIKLGKSEKYDGYIYKAAKNLSYRNCQKELMRLRKSTAWDDSKDLVDESSPMLYEEDYTYTRFELQRLFARANTSELDQEILMLKYGHGLSSREVASAMASKLDTKVLTGNIEDYINNRAKRAKDKLYKACIAS